MTLVSTVASPLGDLTVTRDDEGITGLYLPTGRHATRPAPADWVRDDDAFEDVRIQLAEYFAGLRHDFELPLRASGTAFQRRVWDVLVSIPYGTTATYGRIADLLGTPTAVRAVGAANGQNPISIVVPCHRVIGADGSLTGYGGGVAAKRWLLDHESAFARPSLFG